MQELFWVFASHVGQRESWVEMVPAEDQVSGWGPVCGRNDEFG